MGDLFAPASADVDLESIFSIGDGVEAAVSDTTTAVFTDIFINLHDAVDKFWSTVGTGFCYRTFLTSFAEGCIIGRNSLTDNTQVI